MAAALERACACYGQASMLTINTFVEIRFHGLEQASAKVDRPSYVNLKLTLIIQAWS